jgi:hypothetical protein
MCSFFLQYDLFFTSTLPQEGDDEEPTSVEMMDAMTTREGKRKRDSGVETVDEQVRSFDIIMPKVIC